MKERFQSTKTTTEYKQKLKKCKYYESKNAINKCFVSSCKIETTQKILRSWHLIPQIVFYNTFLQKLIKKDGKDYESSFLAAMQSSIARYLHESNYEYSILNTRFKAPLLCKGLGKKKKLNKARRRHTVGMWSAR